MRFAPGPSFDLATYHSKREQTEVKEDPEQLAAYEKIIEILGAAGYFRARFPALSPFDKVLGGLAWAIAGSAVDVDVDVFFDEDATLGEKNNCAEDVCRALLRMKCPNTLRSFQITRSDWKSVYPVVIWVVKTVLETREETAALIRRYAESRFDKQTTHPSDAKRQATTEQAEEYLNVVQTHLGAKRKYKQSGAAVQAGRSKESERVLNVLREYGTLGGSVKSEEDGSGLADGYASWAHRENVAGSVLGGIMGMQGDELRKYRALYEEGRDNRPLSEAQLAHRMHLSKVQALQTRLKEGKSMLSSLQQQLEQGSARLANMMAQCEAKRLENEKLEQGLAAFKAQMEQSEFAATIKELQGLVTLNEQLKGQMAQFEASCQRMMEELRASVLALRGDGEDEDSMYVKRVEAAHAEGKAKLTQLKAIAAKKNRTVLLLSRKLDEIPSHSELAQYGRMLVELYEQINAKFVETRKHYNSFNALDDSRRHLEGELSILKSISDQYGDAMKSKSNKEAFVNSMQSIVASVETSYDKTTQKHTEESSKRDALHAEHVALLEKQREYAKLTKEFSTEAQKATELENRLNSNK